MKRRCFLILRCRLFLSLRSRIRQALDCSPTNRERELGLDRRETDDLITGQGVVSSRAASILRSVETYPLIGRFMQCAHRSLTNLSNRLFGETRVSPNEQSIDTAHNT
ncbi:hypothetical protein DINM_003473 [Dirofilaria immitis]|nr:hypothetical protein [Dirofilaria immitis]